MEKQIVKRILIGVAFLLIRQTVSLANDTLLLPLHKGLIRYSKIDSMPTAHPTGISIYPQNDLRILSCSNGNVVKIFSLREGLNLVIVENSDSEYFIYGGVDSVIVSKNQKIAVGQVIGLIIKTGTDEDSITFSVMKNKEYLNPERFVAKTPRCP